MEFGLLKFVNSKYLADVTIRFEDVSYKAHKVVLAGASEYYFRLFENESKSEFGLPPLLEPKFSKVSIKALFENILRYIYTDQDFEVISESLNENTVNTYLSAGYSLGISSLVEIAADYIIQHILSPENCVDYMAEALKFYADTLREAATERILSNFQEILKVPRNFEGLLALPYKIILEVIASDALKVENEKIVYDFVCSYIEPSRETDRKPLSEAEKIEILGKIRWPFLSHSELLDAAANPKISVCKDLVLEGLSVQLAEHSKPKDYVYKVIKLPRTSYVMQMPTNPSTKSIPKKNSKPQEAPIRFLSKSQNQWKSLQSHPPENTFPHPPQKISKVSRQTDRELSYAHDFDENGALYYLGSEGGVKPWENPSSLGAVKVFSSSISSGRVEDLAGRGLSGFKTKNEVNAYIGVDLGPNRGLKVTAYTIRNGNSSSHTMLSWAFEASNNESDWVVVDRRNHSTSENVKYLSEKGKTSTWGVAGADRPYRYFRIVITERNLAGNYILSISCLELYGSITGRGWE